MRLDSYLTHLIFLLLVSVAVSHAHVPQQAQLDKFILYRRSSRTSSSNSSLHGSGVSVRSSLQAQAGYSGSGDQSALKAADKIPAPPGQPEGVDFDQYGGYVIVDEKNGRALFYYLVEAPQDASSKPLLLWLNGAGGPGCSSLGFGAMLELGPFRVNNDNKTLRINKYAWNNEAGTCGNIGMMWCSEELCLISGGSFKAARMIVLFGEAGYPSNTGCVMPSITGLPVSVEKNQVGTIVPSVPFLYKKRIAEANVLFLESPTGVGFSYSNTSSDDESGDTKTAEDAYIFLVNWLERFPEYKAHAFYISGVSYAGHHAPQLAAIILSHNLYSNQTIVNLQGIFVGNPYLDLKGRYEYLWNHGVISDELMANITHHCSFTSSDNDMCSDIYKWYDYGPIDRYNIYAPVCIVEHDGSYHSSSYLPDACDYYPTVTNLNDPVVQEAFHARKTEWGACSDIGWKDAPESMVPTLQWLIKQGLPIWFFSGDFNYICPLTATRYSIHDLNLSVTAPWRPWTANEEVGGFVQQYTGGFTFASVRASGHMVPSDQPERALILLQSFLQGVLPPYIQEQ